MGPAGRGRRSPSRSAPPLRLHSNGRAFPWQRDARGRGRHGEAALGSAEPTLWSLGVFGPGCAHAAPAVSPPRAAPSVPSCPPPRPFPDTSPCLGGPIRVLFPFVTICALPSPCPRVGASHPPRVSPCVPSTRVPPSPTHVGLSIASPALQTPPPRAKPRPFPNSRAHFRSHAPSC